MLKDPLLVRTGRGMQLTPRAKRLRALADQSCASIEALFAEEIFEPMSATTAFSVATPDYLALMVGQELLVTLRQTAPGVRVRFVDASVRVREQLLTAEIDLALVAHVPEVLEGLSVQPDFHDDLVCVVARGHALARRVRLSWADIQRHPRLSIEGTSDRVVFTGAGQPTEQIGIAPTHLLALPLLAAAVDSIAIVPRSLGVLAARHAAVKVIELASHDEDVEFCLAWSPVRDSDLPLRWLRQRIATILDRNITVPGRRRTKEG